MEGPEEQQQNPLVRTKAHMQKFIENCANLNTAYRAKHDELMRVFETFKVLYERYLSVKENITGFLETTLHMVEEADKNKMSRPQMEKLLEQQRDALVEVQNLEKGMMDVAETYKKVFQKDITTPIDKILTLETTYNGEETITYVKENKPDQKINVFTVELHGDTPGTIPMTPEDIKETYAQMRRMYKTGRKLLEHMILNLPFLVTLPALIMYSDVFRPLILANDSFASQEKALPLKTKTYGLCCLIDPEKSSRDALIRVFLPAKSPNASTTISYTKQIKEIQLDQKKLYQIELNMKFNTVAVNGRVYFYPIDSRIQFMFPRFLDLLTQFGDGASLFMFSDNYFPLGNFRYWVGTTAFLSYPFKEQKTPIGVEEYKILHYDDFITFDKEATDGMTKEGVKFTNKDTYDKFLQYKQNIYVPLKDRSSLPKLDPETSLEKSPPNAVDISKARDLFKYPKTFLEVLEEVVA